MWADTRAELLAMADAIGVSRKHLQEPPKASWLHFDICLSKHAFAVRHGAIETDRYGPLEYRARQDMASRDPARVRLGEISLGVIERKRRARRNQPVDGLPLFQENRHG